MFLSPEISDENTPNPSLFLLPPSDASNPPPDMSAAAPSPNHTPPRVLRRHLARAPPPRPVSRRLAAAPRRRASPATSPRIRSGRTGSGAPTLAGPPPVKLRPPPTNLDPIARNPRSVSEVIFLSKSPNLCNFYAMFVMSYLCICSSILRM